MVSHAVVVSSPVSAPHPQPLASITKLTLSPGARSAPPSPGLQRLFAAGDKRRGGGDTAPDDDIADRYAFLLQMAARAAVLRNRRAASELAALRKENAGLRAAKLEEKTAAARRKCAADLGTNGTTAPPPKPTCSS